MLAGGTMKK